MFLAIPGFIGCSGEGDNSPHISSHPDSLGNTSNLSMEFGRRSDADASQTGRPSSTALSNDATADAITNLTSGSFDGSPVGSDPGDEAMISMTSTPTGVIVRLQWEHPPDINTIGYEIYYGKEPAQEAGSCSGYEAHQAVDAPPATIVGLEHDALYYFAVKHFNDLEDACSEEIMVATPPLPPKSQL